MAYKVGIIGATRRFQGTGAYIARVFADSGHQIAGVVGTSTESAKQAALDLARLYAIQTTGYTCLDILLQQHAIDILVIASPPATHLEYLQLGTSHNLHIFCEKPFWWPDKILDLTYYQQTLKDVVDKAKYNHRHLQLNTQWPYTLKDFNRLHPEVLSDGKINYFSIRLSPQSKGINMLIDAASHGLSMLYQLVGRGDLNQILIERTDCSATIKFDYLHKQGCTKTTFEFIQSNETPKPASYQINGYSVRRTVTLPEYQIQLQSEQQTISIQDPLEASIQDFLASIEAEIEIDEDILMLGAQHLYQLVENYQTKP